MNNKSIEQWAEDYAPMSPSDGHTSALEQEAFIAGAKFREAQLMDIVNKLKDILMAVRRNTNDNYLQDSIEVDVDNINEALDGMRIK